MTCANGRPARKVYDDSGCCYDYECECVCEVVNVLHHVTFDGTSYIYRGNCTYVLVQQINNKYDDFRIYINEQQQKLERDIGSQSLWIFYKSNSVYLTREQNINKVFLNDHQVFGSVNKDGFKVYTTGILVYVEIPSFQGLIVYGGTFSRVQLPYKLFFNNTEGLCGTCTNNQKDDCHLPDGTISASCTEMPPYWLTSDQNNTVCAPETKPTVPPTSTTTSPSKTTEISKCIPQLCELMNSDVFAECHKLLPPDAFYNICKADGCQVNTTSLECSNLQNYASMCAELGVCINWRNYTEGKCLFPCPATKEYRACGPPSEVTCNHRYNEEFVTKDHKAITIAEGCFCPNGTTLFNSQTDTCVSSCDCVGPEGEPKQPNETWQSNCHQCVCDKESMSIQCKPLQCPLLPVPSCNKDGQVLVTEPMVNNSCCNVSKCECNINFCSHAVKSCEAGYQLVARTPTDGCCPVYDCVPKKVCIFNNTEYQPGATVPSSICEECKCSSEIDADTKLFKIDCNTKKCDKNCHAGFTYQDVVGQCCGRCVQIACIFPMPSSANNPGSTNGKPKNNNDNSNDSNNYPNDNNSNPNSESSNPNGGNKDNPNGNTNHPTGNNSNPSSKNSTKNDNKPDDNDNNHDGRPKENNNSNDNSGNPKGTFDNPKSNNNSANGNDNRPTGNTTSPKSKNTTKNDDRNTEGNNINQETKSKENDDNPNDNNGNHKGINDSPNGHNNNSNPIYNNPNNNNEKPDENNKHPTGNNSRPIDTETSNSSMLYVLMPGQTVTFPGDNCTHYECYMIDGHYVSISSKKSCPEFHPEDCLPGTIRLTSDGCCQTCDEKPKQCKVHKNTTYITHEGCQSLNPVAVSSCEGACNTYSMYSSEANAMEHKCSCCQELQTSFKNTTLKCSNGTIFSYSYIYVEECSCRDTRCEAKDHFWSGVTASITEEEKKNDRKTEGQQNNNQTDKGKLKDKDSTAVTKKATQNT
ncbi:mucin-5B-like [Polypterus senegalus]|uniref:mucin-5B-like n=1 Tax=Polypterus senegalus TaxID=55291 RepID=UPI0019661A2B|nr:mucin-5B-like [Polypterus senegalus]